MKRWPTHSPRAPEAGGARRTRASLRLACALLLSLPAFGCVSSAAYQEVAEERDLLRDEKARLEESIANLEAERVRLADQLEDQRIRGDALQRERSDLSRRGKDLEQRLRDAEVPLAGDAASPRAAELRAALARELETEVSTGFVDVTPIAGGLRLRVAEEVLFPPGGVELNDAGKMALERIASVLRDGDEEIDVRVVHDAAPKGALAKKHPSAWHVASARALAVTARLTEKGVPATRLAASARGAAAPASGVGSARRIELRVLGAAEAVAPDASSSALAPEGDAARAPASGTTNPAR